MTIHYHIESMVVMMLVSTDHESHTDSWWRRRAPAWMVVAPWMSTAINDGRLFVDNRRAASDDRWRSRQSGCLHFMNHHVAHTLLLEPNSRDDRRTNGPLRVRQQGAIFAEVACIARPPPARGRRPDERRLNP